jgi:hypothetical protein
MNIWGARDDLYNIHPKLCVSITVSFQFGWDLEWSIHNDKSAHTRHLLLNLNCKMSPAGTTGFKISTPCNGSPSQGLSVVLLLNTGYPLARAG